MKRESQAKSDLFIEDEDSESKGKDVDDDDDDENDDEHNNNSSDKTASLQSTVPSDAADDIEMMDLESVGESQPTYIVVSIDSLKYGDYKTSTDLHVVRVTHKDIHIDAVIFHQRSLQINFHCLSFLDPLLTKYGATKSSQFIWHAQLVNDIVPEECEMRAAEREFVLKKKNGSQWNSGLLQCSSTSAISTSRSSSLVRTYTQRPSVSYRYMSSQGLPTGHSGLPPSGQQSSSSSSNPVKYQRASYVPTTRISYSPLTYASSHALLTQSSTPRTRSSSSILRWSSSSSLISSSTYNSMNAAQQSSSNNSFASSGRIPKSTISPLFTGRPTAKVSPYEERGTLVEYGFTGLRNIGNTCFMNATLQMLVNCKELQVYFTGDHYKDDLNVTNPLGFGGRFAHVFAEFVKQMWSGMNRAIEPTKIKELVAEKAFQFANFAQHDAQEFLSFVIDGLHEDLNRVRSKPSTNSIEAEGRPDFEVSKEAWRNHLLRNDSIFVDLFHGQLKSRLQCPKCSRISITFDPFVYLSVPFPKEKRSTTVHFWPLDPCLKPIEITVRYNNDGKVSELLYAIAELVNVNAKALRIIEVNNHRIAKIYALDDDASQILSIDTIYVFQVHDHNDCNEDVIEIAVVQRLLFRKSILRACANCGSSDERLKICERCYDAFYCKKECQVDHWNKDHKLKCKQRPQADAVGQPFIISLPKSKLTYANIFRCLESRCRHSVNVFQPPVENNNGSSSDLFDGTQDSSFNISPSPSASTVNGNCIGTTELPAVNTTNAKRQMVLGEPRNKARPGCRLFLIRKLQQPDSIIGDTLADTPGVLNIPNETFLSINWSNLKLGKDYLTVETKSEIDSDKDKTAHYKKISSTTNLNSTSANPSIYDMLGMFSETERLKPEESWYCNKCKEHVEATKQLVLYRLPPVLIIQLKRFVYTTSLLSMHRRSKDDRPVRYPTEGLDLSKYLADTAVKNQETKYDLTGVVCHSGTSYFGHYVSVGRLASLDGKTSEIDWRVFDDSVVSRASLSRVEDSDAYLLFYKQRGAITNNLLRKRYGVGRE